jgi:hypothetical protein
LDRVIAENSEIYNGDCRDSPAAAAYRLSKTMKVKPSLANADVFPSRRAKESESVAKAHPVGLIPFDH